MREVALVGTATINGGTALAIGSANIVSGGGVDGEAFGDLDIAGDLVLQLQPSRQGTLVEPAIEILINGIAVPQERLLGTFSYRMSLDDSVQSNAFTLILPNGTGYYGNPATFHGPPFGTAPISIFGVYRTAAGERRIALLTDGICETISRGGSPDAGWSESFQVSDQGAKLDGLVATLVIRPGSGIRRGQIVDRLFRQLGVTRFRLDPGGLVYRGVEFVGADVFRAGAAHMEVDGRALFFDAEGFLTNPVIGDTAGLPVRWTWTERDFLAVEQATSTTPRDVLTEATLTGFEQILRDETEGDAPTSRTVPVIIERDYAPVLNQFRQETNCTLTNLLPPASAPRRMIVSEVYTTTETRRGRITFQGVISFAWKLAQIGRYVYASAGVRNCRGGVFLPVGSASQGSEPAYSSQAERWAQTGLQQVWHYYDRVGYHGPAVTPGDPQQPWSTHFLGGRHDGYKLGRISETWAFYIRRAAVKHKGLGQQSTPWDELDPIVGRETLGNGEGIAGTGQQETLQRVAREVEVITSTADGYVARVDVYRYGWTIEPGGDYLFADGATSSADLEAFKLLEVQTTLYAHVGDQLAVLRSVTPYVGDSPGSTTTEATFADGAPPAVERITDETPQPEDFETPEDFARARTAREFETRPIKAIVSAPALADVHAQRKAEQSSDFAETVEELADMARRMIERTAAIPHQFAISVNFDVRPGQVAHIRHGALGWDYPVQIHDVEHVLNPAAGDLGAFNVTRITAKKYPSRI